MKIDSVNIKKHYYVKVYNEIFYTFYQLMRLAFHSYHTDINVPLTFLVFKGDGFLFPLGKPLAVSNRKANLRS